jgi:signal transduction histidine kinase
VPTLLLLLFPDGRPPSRRWAWLVPVTLLVIASASADWATTPWPDLGEPVIDPSTPNPVGSGGLTGPLDWLGYLLPLCVVLSIASVVVRLRRAEGVERQQLRWFGAGAALTLTVLAAGQALGETLAPFALGAGLVILPACVAVAVLRHGLWELGPIARRSVVYGTLSAAILGVYGLAALALGGGEVIATAVVAVALLPARERLERGVNRLLYGDRDEPWAAVRSLGERLAQPATTADVELEVARALRLPRVRIDAPGTLEPAPADDDLRVPLVFHGEPVGTLVAGGRELGGADRAALADLAPHLAAAVHATRLTDDLRRSRERLVAAREEERRRLRNDLHDELGPSLAMLALRLDAARDLAAGPEGERVLGDLAGQARDGLGQVRAIVRDLRPAVLDDLGLAAALEEQVDALRRGGLDARLDVPEALGKLPAAPEVAAYRIAREAMSNVVRHARARSCTVTLRLQDGALCVEIRDDGRGMRAGAPRGVGLESMAARADELGGTFAVTSGGDGTSVEARLPL